VPFSDEFQTHRRRGPSNLASFPVTPASGGGGGVQIASVSGTTTHGSTLTIAGSGFGSHADYGGSEAFICKAWNDFTVSMEDGNWEFDGLTQNADNLILSTSSPLGGACTQFYRKRNINDSAVERQGSVTVPVASNTGVFYTSFWYRESAHSTLGLGDGTKFFRHYFGTSPRDFYLGPNFANTTEASGIYGGHNGRYSGTAAFGGTSAMNTLLDTAGSGDVWHWYEVTTYTRGGTSVFGSDDYLEIYVTIPGTGRQRMMRRGSGLASNAIAAEGTNANENNQWVGADVSNSDADGHTCGDLGSLYGAALGGSGGHMDFHDAYQSYTIARVVVGNASTYSACDRFHMQIPTAWSSTSITVTANRGSFSNLSGNYLYVVASDNTVNSSGFMLS
jgi:hypothetical protein